MPGLDRITVAMDVLVPQGAHTIVDGMSVEDLIRHVHSGAAILSPVRIVSEPMAEDGMTPGEVVGAVMEAGSDVMHVVRPMQMEQPADHLDTVPILSATDTVDGWRGAWSIAGGGTSESPELHPTKEDALTDARRREAALRNPEAEADEFEDAAHQDPFDATIHYGCMLIEDENRWRGRWYRDQWTSEGAYTDLLYDTPGQARRAARRLRTTGDES